MNSPWDLGKRRRRLVKGRVRTEWVYPVACAKYELLRWLKKAHAQKALAEQTLCFSCAQSLRGKKGFAATAARFGRDFLIPKVRAYRLEHPSQLEVEMMLLFEKLGLSYEREVLCKSENRTYLIDFTIGELAIEVHGEFYHRNSQERDARKALAISACGYQFLLISEAQIKAGLARQALVTALSLKEVLYENR